jgi:hypothetical protein
VKSVAESETCELCVVEGGREDDLREKRYLYILATTKNDQGEKPPRSTKAVKVTAPPTSLTHRISPNPEKLPQLL